jgi:hypothetical protein
MIQGNRDMQTPGGNKNPEIIKNFSGVAREACRLFVAEFGKGEVPFRNKFVKIEPGISQFSADTQLTYADCVSTFEDFSDRILAPLASRLAAVVPKGCAFYPLELPMGCQAGREMLDNISVRTVVGWTFPPIWEAESIIGYADPVPVLRLDVVIDKIEAA